MVALSPDYKKLTDILAETEGWLLPEAAAIWDCLYSFQAAQGIAGHHLEIGVWRGKTAAIMATHADAKREKIALVDLHIQKDKVVPTLQKVSANLGHVTYIETPSSAFLHNEQVKELASGCRWVHIDGKHTGDAVYNDMKIADKYLSANGIVCIDDFFDFQYPQVTAGVFKFLHLNPYSFSLFLCGFRKAYLARPEYVYEYLGYCGDIVGDLEKRGIETTLSKTTYTSDLNCFSLVPRYAGWRMRGTDWDKDHLETNTLTPGRKVEGIAA